MSEDAPYIQNLKANSAAFALTVDGHAGCGIAAFAGTLSSASFIPEAAITGANTDTRTLTIVNKGQDGSGTTVMATLAFVSGVNGVAYDEKAFTLSAVANATTVAAGDVIEFVSTHGGSTGLADPGGVVALKIARA